MTTAEFETEAQSFTAKLTRRQLNRLQEMIEDMHDIRAVEQFHARNEKTTPWEEVKRKIEKRFGINE